MIIAYYIKLILRCFYKNFLNLRWGLIGDALSNLVPFLQFKWYKWGGGGGVGGEKDGCEGVIHTTG